MNHNHYPDPDCNLHQKAFDFLRHDIGSAAIITSDRSAQGREEGWADSHEPSERVDPSGRKDFSN